MVQPRAAVRPPRPINESERLDALYRSRALGIESEKALEDLVEVAAYVTGMPIASVNFLDEEQQQSAAARGVDRTVMGSLTRDEAVCSYTILSSGVLQIPDMREDPRTCQNAKITASGLRHYSGAPIVDRDGHALGALCVLDMAPRHLTAEQVGALAALARQAAILVEWRNSRAAVGGLVRRRQGRGAAV